MTAATQNSPDALCAEILASARRESDEILNHARAAAQSLLADVETQSKELREQGREQAEKEAARRKETLLATIAVEEIWLRSKHSEALLESIHKEIHRRLLTPEVKSRETITTLAAEALREMPGTEFILKISIANFSNFGAGLADEIVQFVGRSSLRLKIISDPGITDDGVIVADAEGTRIWDNCLLSRLERFWPELRRQIAISTSLLDKQRISGVSR